MDIYWIKYAFHNYFVKCVIFFKWNSSVPILPEITGKIEKNMGKTSLGDEEGTRQIQYAPFTLPERHTNNVIGAKKARKIRMKLTWVDQRFNVLRLGSLISVSAHPLVTWVKARFRHSKLPSGPELNSWATSTSVDLEGRDKALGPPFSCCVEIRKRKRKRKTFTRFVQMFSCWLVEWGLCAYQQFECGLLLTEFLVGVQAFCGALKCLCHLHTSLLFWQDV